MIRKLVSLLCCAAVLAPSSAGAADAVLILLDKSMSMGQDDKWATASQAIVQALDRNGFDALELGLIAAPSGTVTGPACVLGLPVGCEVPVFPQVAIGPAGAKSGMGPGKRQDISDWLTTNLPESVDGFPMYGAVQTAVTVLQSWSGSGHRILVIVTDGGISCGQLSTRPGYGDCIGCDHEWEHPLNIAGLLAAANGDPTRPVEAFVIGVPGADTYDATACSFPPYHMRLALSAIAAAGSPDNVPDGCDGTYTQGGGDPTTPCHFDLTLGNFDVSSLSNTIADVRDVVLGTVGVPVRDGPTAARFFLAPPEPNPARDRAKIVFGLPREGRTTVSVHDVAGRLVRQIANEWLQPGRYVTEWDLTDAAGVPVPGGLYFLRVVANGDARTASLSIVH